MFKHLFKLIWNKKKQNALLITEMLVSFMVTFAVFSMIVKFYFNYKTPMGFEYKNVWLININNPPHFDNTDSAATYYKNVRNVLTAMPQVVQISFGTGLVPFSNSIATTGFTHKGKKFDDIRLYGIDDNYKNTFSPKLIEGRWFNKQDEAGSYAPVIINESFRKKAFGTGKVIGEMLGDWEGRETNQRIVGVIADTKEKGDYRETASSLFIRNNRDSYKDIRRIFVKVTPDADAGFEGRLFKTTSNMMKQSSIEIKHFVQMRDDMNKETLTPIIILIILASFLIINVALGLFGVLWYNINKRRGEIGLRRAVGASGSSVSWQIVAESMVLATLSLIAGTFFAAQFPLLNVFELSASVYITAIFLSVIFIYLLVLVCSLYPGKQAAAVYPAVALHED